MPLILAGDRLLLFAHVPKAGGTSFEGYLEARFGALMLRDHFWANRRLRRRSLVVSPQHIDGADLERMFPPETLALSFAITREPVARVLSEFKYQGWPHNIRTPFRKVLARLGFSVWLGMALAAARKSPGFFDNHLRPQVEMIPEGAEIFRLEDGFDALIARIDAVTGTTAPDLEVGHEVRGPGPRRPVQPSRQDLALIARAFGADFERLGYDLPDLSEAPSDPFAWARHGAGRLLSPLARGLYRAGLM